MAGMRSGREPVANNRVADFAVEVAIVGLLFEREESDLSFPFARDAAFGKQQYLFNGLTDWDFLTNLKDSGHRQSVGDAIISVLFHGRYVMREEDAAFRRCPLKYIRVVLGS